MEILHTITFVILFFGTDQSTQYYALGDFPNLGDCNNHLVILKNEGFLKGKEEAECAQLVKIRKVKT